METIYGSLWSKQFQESDGHANTKAIQLWMVALVQRGIKTEDLQRVIHKTLDKYVQFPPRLAQVIEMCQLTEAELNLPSFEEAYKEATSGRLSYRPKKSGAALISPSERFWSWAKQTHPAIFHAVQAVKPNIYTFDRAEAKQSEMMFKAAWQEVIKRLKQGEHLAPVPKVLKSCG
jgi:hypothetical protein